MKRKIIAVDPEVMGGTPCFAGTRVPVRTLLDYLEAGDSVDGFLEGFPTVSRQQVIDFLESAAQQAVTALTRREIGGAVAGGDVTDAAWQSPGHWVKASRLRWPSPRSSS